MTWACKAFKLELSQPELWHIEPFLQSYDDSLAAHLTTLLCGADGTAGREFARRIRSMESHAMQIGKTLPARKLLSMCGQHSLKDPSYSDALWESRFTALCCAGPSLQDLLEFSDY